MQAHTHRDGEVAQLLRNTQREIDCEHKYLVFARVLLLCFSSAMEGIMHHVKSEIRAAEQHPAMKIFNTKFYLDTAALNLDTIINIWQTVWCLSE